MKNILAYFSTASVMKSQQPSDEEKSFITSTPGQGLCQGAEQNLPQDHSERGDTGTNAIKLFRA